MTFPLEGAKVLRGLCTTEQVEFATWLYARLPSYVTSRSLTVPCPYLPSQERYFPWLMLVATQDADFWFIDSVEVRPPALPCPTPELYVASLPLDRTS